MAPNETPKPTDSVEVESYRERFQSAVTFRQAYESEWSMCIDAYIGNLNEIQYTKIYPETYDPEGRRFGNYIDVNNAKMIVDTMVSSSSTRIPKINVFARQSDHEPQRRILEAVVNYWWKTWGVQDVFHRATIDNVMIGHGWVKDVWQLVEEKRKLTPEERESRVQQALAEQEAVPGGGVSESYVREYFDNQRDLVTVLHNEYPQAVYVSPFDMFVDPHAIHIDDARWLAHRFYEPLYLVKHDKKYKAKARQAVAASAASSTLNYNTGMSGRDRARLHGDASAAVNPLDELVELVEFHDIEKGTWCVFSRDSGDYLIEPRPSPFHGTPYKTPFEMLRNHEAHRLYPIGDVWPVLPLIWEHSETRTQQMSQRRQLNTKFIAEANALDAVAVSALQSAEPGKLIPIRKQQSQRLEDVIQPLHQPSMPPDFSIASETILNDIERITGVTEVAMGTAQVSRRSATEAQILEAASSGRASLKLEAAQRAAARIGGRMVIMAQLFLKGRDVAEIVGKDGLTDWVNFGREQIQGMFSFEVEHGSMAARGDVAKRQDAIAITQSLALLAPLQNTGIIDTRVVAEMILRAWGQDNVEDFFINLPPQQMMPPSNVTPPQPNPRGNPMLPL